MQVVVHGQRVEITPELHAQVASQALAALGRFGGRIGPVTVRLHAPCGGADALPICYILVDIHPLGVLGVGDAAPSLEAAADRALERASAVVTDELTRRRRLREHGSLAYSATSSPTSEARWRAGGRSLRLNSGAPGG